MPVAPPSIKWLVKRNPLKPKAAEKIPSVTSIKSLKSRVTLTLKLLNPLASSKLEYFFPAPASFPLCRSVVLIIICFQKGLIMLPVWFTIKIYTTTLPKKARNYQSIFKGFTEE